MKRNIMGSFLLHGFVILLMIQIHFSRAENVSNDRSKFMNAVQKVRHLLIKQYLLNHFEADSFSAEKLPRISKKSWQIPLKTLALKKKLDYQNMMHFKILNELTDAFDSFKGKQRQ